MRRRLLLFTLALSTSFLSAHAGEQDKADKKDDKSKYLIVVPPAGGKEVKLIDYRFPLGVRRLALDGAAKPSEYLDFREEKSTTYKNGIFTLIPLAWLKKITYDTAKKTVAVAALKPNGDEVTLVGSTKFANSNKLTIEAEAVLEGLGNATVKYHGGGDKGSLQSVAFPAPQPAVKIKGVPGIVTADDKEKTQHTAYDVRPLYLVDGQYRVVPYLMFKKTVKIDMDKLTALRFTPSDDKKAPNDYEVTLKDGAKHTLSLLTTIEADKKKATLVGLIGRVAVGYKLFSTDAISEYRLETDAK